MSETSIPYWRLSTFYLFYFASLGALVPYWGLYLQSLGFDGRAIGELMAIIMVTKIIAPYIWSWIADHTGRGMMIIRLASVCALISFIGIFWALTFWWLALVMMLFSFFWNATLPQFEATTLNHLGKDTHKYSVIRLWGSLGFILSVAGLGQVLDQQSLAILPFVLLSIFLLISLSSFMVPDAQAQAHQSPHGSMLEVVKQPVVIALLSVCFLAQLSHGPYYTFYSIYLKDNHYSSGSIGALWALGVLAEIVVFFLMVRLMPRFGARHLLISALLLTSLRWLLIGHFVENAGIIIAAQLLHAASFGLYHAVAIELIHQLFKGRYQGRGQALYSSVSFGAGGALGSYMSGLFWDQLGATMVFNLAAVAALLGAFISWRYIVLDKN